MRDPKNMDLKKNMKFFRPTQGLPATPPVALKLRNATWMPYIGT